MKPGFEQEKKKEVLLKILFNQPNFPNNNNS